MPEPHLLDSADAGHKVVRGGFVRLGGFGIGLIASIAAAALVSRHLGPADFGRFQTVIALTAIIQIVADAGTSVLGVREYSQREGADRDRFMRVLLGWRLAATAFGVACALVASVLLGYDGAMIVGAGLMGLGFALASLGGTLAIPLQAELRIGTFTAIDVARQVLLAALFVVLVVVGAGIVPFLAAPIPVYVVLLSVTLWFVRGSIPLMPSFDLREWADLVRPTVAVALAASVGSFYLYVAMVIIEQVASAVDTGIFAAAFRVYVIVSAVPALLVTIAFPLLSRAARDDRERLTYASQRLFEAMALLGGAVLIGCVLGADPIIALIAGDEYSDSAAVLRVQGTALALTFVIAAWGFTLLALHLHRPMIITNAIAMTVSAVGVFVLASTHGALGAAFGTLLAEVTLATGYARALSRHDPQMRPQIGLIVRAAPALALGLACWFVPVPAVVSTALGLLVYGLALLLLGAVPNELRDHLPAPLRRLGPSVAAVGK